jgi:hypothetical protein
VAVPAKIDQLASPTTEDELSAPAFPAGRFLVDDDVEVDDGVVGHARDTDSYCVSGLSLGPRGADRDRVAPPIYGSNVDFAGSGNRNKDIAGEGVLRTQIQLNSSAVDVRVLVVESVDRARLDEREVDVTHVDVDGELTSVVTDCDRRRRLAGVFPGVL